MRSHIRFISILFIIAFSVNGYSQESITIVYGAHYKPFAWGENNIAYGVQKDFVEAVLGGKMGIKVKHEAYPWKRCQRMVREGSVDGFFTVATPERAEYTMSSAPFYETHFVMHTGKLNPNVARLKTVRSLEELERLHNINHIYMLGSGWHENALKNMKNITKNVDASTIPIMLKRQRADVYIEQAEMFRYQAKEKGVLEDILTLNEFTMKDLGWRIFIGNKSKHQLELSNEYHLKMFLLKEEYLFQANL